MVQSNLIAEIARSHMSGNTNDVVDIITFAEAPWGLNVNLLPAQKFILKCLYGMELDTHDRYIPVPDLINEKVLYQFNEAEFLKWLYEEGRCNTDEVEGKTFQELVLSIGRRGTKSSISSYISNYEMYKLVKRGDPSKFYGFQPGAQVYILNVAPTDGQAGIVFEMIQNTASQCAYLKDRTLHNTMTYFDVQTDYDLKQKGRKPKGSLISLAGGCSSNALRGRNAIVVIMDEMAFFIDNDGRFSGSEVYKALTPSIASFKRDGKVICISSPYAKYGSFYDRWQESFNETDFTLAFKMYSSMANPTIPTQILAAARRRNRVGFMCEYGAEFSDSVTAWIDDEPEFRRCLTNVPLKSRGEPDTQYFMGVDLGFKNDGTGVAIVHKDQRNSKIILDYADVWFSGSSDVWDIEDGIYTGCNKYADRDLLRMADIVAEIKELVRWFPLKAGIFDQSNGYALAELLIANQLPQIEMENFTDRKNHMVYELTKRMYAEQLLQLYEHPVLVPELLTLEAEKKGKGIVNVRAPKRRGAHDDISDAFARAVWLCYSNFKSRTPNLVAGAGGVVTSNAFTRAGLPNPIASKMNQKSFLIERRKMHGVHPRARDALKRRLPGAVR